MRWFGRLRRSNEIAFVRRRGRAVHLPTLVAYGTDGASGGPRVGITVAKTVGIAVVRNLVRRRIRGALDALIPAGERRRYLFIAKPTAASAGYDALARDVATALERLSAGS